MQIKKVSPKGPLDPKIHCDLLYKNYVRGWVLVDEVQISDFQLILVRSNASQIIADINGPRTDVPRIKGKIAMGFSLVDEEKEIGAGTSIKLEVQYGDSRIEHIEVQSPKELYEIRAISSIENHVNYELSGWLAILDPTLFGSDLCLQTKNGLVQIHIEDRRSDVALMTGITDSFSWVAYGSHFTDPNFYDSNGQIISNCAVGDIRPNEIKAGLTQENNVTEIDSFQPEVIGNVVNFLARYRVDSNPEFGRLTNPNFEFPFQTKLRTSESLLVLLSEKTSLGNDLESENLEAYSFLLKPANIPRNYRFNQNQMRVVATWPSSSGRLCELTEFQRFKLSGSSINIFMNDEVYSDFLTEFVVQCRSLIGGIGLLTENQVQFLKSFDVSQSFFHHKLNRFLSSRFNMIVPFQEIFSLDDEHARLALKVNLFCDELFNGFGESLFSDEDLNRQYGKGCLKDFFALTCFLAGKIHKSVELEEFKAKASAVLEDGLDTWYSTLAANHLLKDSQQNQLNVEEMGHEHYEEFSSARDRYSVLGMVEHRSGLGRWASSSLQVLKLIDTKVESDLLPVYSKYFEKEVQKKKFATGATLIVHLQPDYFTKFVESAPLLNLNRKVIACFAWETQRIPAEWINSLSYADEIWTCSAFSAKAFEKVFDKPIKVSYPVISPIASADFFTRAKLGISLESFVFYFSFDAHSSVYRKNPTSLLQALACVRVVHENVVLLLKIRNFKWVLDSAKSGNSDALELLHELNNREDVILITDDLSEAECTDLMNIADAYISLHCSEGFGYTLAEAMLLGKPTIASNYSSNLEFMDEENSWLVRTDVEEIEFHRYPYCVKGDKWGRPSIEHAIECMLEVVEGGFNVSQKAALGRESIIQKFSISSISEMYRKNLGI